MIKIKNIGVMRLIVLFLFLVSSMLSFSKNFWEKGSFTVDVVESLKLNKTTKTKKYIMNYSNGTLKLTITSPNVNKGEVYTIKGNVKTIYYPSLKQTVTQKLAKDEVNILSVFNKLKGITSNKTQTKNGDQFIFSNNWLTMIKSSGYTVNFSDYKKSGEYTYPTKLAVTDGNSQIIYYFSNFR